MTKLLTQIKMKTENLNKSSLNGTVLFMLKKKIYINNTQIIMLGICKNELVLKVLKIDLIVFKKNIFYVN